MASNEQQDQEEAVAVLNVRMERSLFDAVRGAAEREDRSISNFVRYTLRQRVCAAATGGNET